MPKVGIYNGSRTPFPKTETIINLLAHGEPIINISKKCHCSREMVRSVRDNHSSAIDQQKQIIKASIARLAMNGFNKLNEEMDAGKLTGGLLMTTTGMATDKWIALNNDPQQINVTHTIEPSQNLYSRLDDLASRLNIEPAQVIEAQALPVPSANYDPTLSPSREAQELLPDLSYNGITPDVPCAEKVPTEIGQSE